MAQAMDPKTYALSSEPISVADRVEGISVSNNGTLAYRTGDAGGNVQLMWFDREGKPEGTVGPPGVYNDLAISPDGKRVAVTRFDSAGGTLDLWMIDIERGVPSRFTSDPGMDWEPVWSPDSRTVAFTSDRVKGINAIYTKDANNVGTEQPLIPLGNDSQHTKDWSPDGKLLIITQYAGADLARGQLWVLPLDGDRKPVPFLTMPYLQSQGQFYPIASRGPRWVAYISNETGRTEVYVQSYPPGSGKVQVSSEGGVQPRWRRDGKELFYIAADGKLMAAEVKRALVTFEIAPSKALFQTRMLGGVGGRTNYVFRYDVAADGKRFLIVAEREGETQPITVVLNWAVAVKK
jgi:Tol biopolymer transport system component